MNEQIKQTDVEEINLVSVTNEIIALMNVYGLDEWDKSEVIRLLSHSLGHSIPHSKVQL